MKKIACLLLICAMFVTGCGGGDDVLNRDLTKDEVFRVEREICTTAELQLFLNCVGSQYEDVLGEELFEQQIEDKTVEDYIKENAITQLVKMKTMSILASERSIALTDEEKSILENAANEYYEALSETDREVYTLDLIESLYTDYCLSNKVYEDITKDYTDNITENDVRVITVINIFLQTYTESNGVRTEYTDEQRQVQLTDIQEALASAKAGTDFIELEEEYSDDVRGQISIEPHTMDEEYEKVVYNLKDGEISQVIETEDGYYIVKCISARDDEKTEANKQNAINEAKLSMFNEVYDPFAQELNVDINSEAYATVTYEASDSSNISQLFEVYDKYF